MTDLPINKIVCGDNVATMATFPAESIDLVVTSPPYDNLRTYGGHTWDFEGVAQELWRIIKPGGVVVWVVSDATVNGSETGTSFRQALRFMEIGFRLHDTMIYHKAGCPFPETNRYYPSWEFMFVLSSGSPKSVNLIADKRNEYAGDKKARQRSERQRDGLVKENTAWRNNRDARRKEYGVRESIWRYSGGRGNTTPDVYAFEHPAMFPEALARDHILSWSNEGDIVLDPFSGSGTTAKMAKHNGRRYIGIEINPEYCEIAANRLEQQVFEFGD
jgi:DNA modification methylase